MKNVLKIIVFFVFQTNIFAQGCPQYSGLVKQGNDFRQAKEYQKALNKYNAAKLCAPEKSKEVDKLINDLFNRIENEKKEAIKQQNAATALYWASEADQLSPTQGLRLLEKAATNTKDEKALRFVRQQTEKIFNESSVHQFHEMSRFEFDKSDTLSPDGRWLVTINEDRTVSIRETDSGKTPDFLNKERDVSRVNFSPDSKWIIISQSYMAKVFEVATGNCQNFGKNLIRETEFSPDSKWIIILNEDRSIDLWDLTHAKIRYFFDEKKPMRNATFSPGGRWVMITFDSLAACVVDTRSGEAHEFLKQEQQVTDGGFSADDKWLYTANENFRYRIWEVATGIPHDFLKDYNDVLKASFSDDSKWIMTWGDETKVWSLSSEKTHFSLSDSSHITNAAFSHDSQWILTQHEDSTAKVWSVLSGEKRNFLNSEKRINRAYFSPDSRWIVTKSADKTRTVWDVVSGTKHDFLNDESQIDDVVFSSDSRLLITKHKNQTAKKWKLDLNTFPDTGNYEKQLNKFSGISGDEKWIITTNNLNQFKVSKSASGELPHFLINEKQIRYATVSPDSKWIITKNDSATKVWHSDSGSFRDFLRNENQIKQIDFSPDSKWMVTKDAKNASKVWELESGKSPNFLSETIEDVAFSSDSRYLITTVSSESKVWELATGKVPNFLKDESEMRGARFSEDSQLLVTVDDSSNVYLWRVGNSKKNKFLKGYYRYSNAIFSRDNKWIALQNTKGEVDIFSLESKNPNDVLKYEDEILQVSFSQDSRWMITTDDHRAKIWSLNQRKLHDLSKNDVKIQDAVFSYDGKWVIATNRNETVDVFEMNSGERPDFLRDKQLLNAIVSRDGRILVIRTKYFVESFELPSGKPLLQLYFNGTPTDIKLVNDKTLYIIADNQIIKADPYSKKHFFRFISKEKMTYTYNEIKEWMNLFGDQFLDPLSDETRERYGVSD